MPELPFVSHMLVTGKDSRRVEHFLPVAVECYHEQTWPRERRELVLVSDGPEDLSRFQAEGVTILQVPKGLTLGELRNLALDRMRGDIWIAQDDDDPVTPTRTEEQVKALLSVPDAQASVLKREVAYCFGTDTACIRDFGGHGMHGTLCVRRSDRRYPALSKGEDTAFLQGLKLVLMDNDPGLFLRLAHGENTWGDDFVMRWAHQPWAKGEWHIGDRLRRILCRYLARFPGLRAG